MRDDLASAATLQVGEWRVAPTLNQISRGAECVRAEPKAIELLVYLAQRSGDVVSRDELMTALWPGVVVGDNALTQVVTKLRKALGDTAREPSYIEAIAKRGYRLIAAVEWLDRATTPPPPPPPPSSPPPPVHAPPQPPAQATGSGIARASRRRRAVAGTLAALAVAVAAAGWVVHRSTHDGALSSLPPEPSTPSLAGKRPTVIVRPIDAIGAEAEKLIARGLTADLVNDLSKLSGLWVVTGSDPANPAPRAAEPSAGPPAAGRYALAGTLQSDGKTLRLHVHLSEVDAGRQVWSLRVEREMRELFAVQDELVRSVVEQLPLEVSQAELASLAQRYTRNLAAYEHFQRAQAAVQARRRAQNDVARLSYWKAIELDPTFARAYAGLAMTHALAWQLGWDDATALDRAVEFARTAQQMSAAMPEAHWVLGFVQTQRRRHADALEHLQRAIRLNASYADAYALMGGIKTYTGQPAESVALLRTALRLNPDAGSLYFLLLGRALYFVGEHEQALVNLEHALARNAENVEARVYLAAVLAEVGDAERAAWQTQEIRAIEPGFGTSRWLATYPMTDKRQTERLTQALSRLGL